VQFDRDILFQYLDTIAVNCARITSA